jgi:hypothetical protein
LWVCSAAKCYEAVDEYAMKGEQPVAFKRNRLQLMRLSVITKYHVLQISLVRFRVKVEEFQGSWGCRFLVLEKVFFLKAARYVLIQAQFDFKCMLLFLFSAKNTENTVNSSNLIICKLVKTGNDQYNSIDKDETLVVRRKHLLSCFRITIVEKLLK